MSHDFAKSRAGKKKPAKQARNSRFAPAPSRIPGWVFFISGILLTLFIQFLYQLAQVETPPTAKTTATDKTEVAQPEPKPKPQEPVYDFYNNLKTMEVKVPDNKVKQREQESFNQILQVGSFKTMNDAEQQRAEIILLGLKANVESSKGSNGATWYRVLVGPFTSRSDMSKARSILINNGMPTLVLKR